MIADWQTYVALVIALACAVWVLWYVARPLFTKVAEICGICSDSPEARDEVELLQIEPACSDKR